MFFLLICNINDIAKAIIKQIERNLKLNLLLLLKIALKHCSTIGDKNCPKNIALLTIDNAIEVELFRNFDCV